MKTLLESIFDDDQIYVDNSCDVDPYYETNGSCEELLEWFHKRGFIPTNKEQNDLTQSLKNNKFYMTPKGHIFQGKLEYWVQDIGNGWVLHLGKIGSGGVALFRINEMSKNKTEFASLSNTGSTQAWNVYRTRIFKLFEEYGYKRKDIRGGVHFTKTH